MEKDEKMKEDLPKPILIEDLRYLYPNENSKQKRRYGIYKCGFCGTEFKAITNSINSGHTKSCGCYQKRRVKETNTKHNLSYTRIHKIWAKLKGRVLNTKSHKYPDYGGRGITICEEWLDVQNFYNWAMSNGYEENKGLSLRIRILPNSKMLVLSELVANGGTMTTLT
jgi:DNA-directed RNA polymerase subunit RPC12/RpoP